MAQGSDPTRPGAKDAALADEQRQLDRVYDRVDVLRDRAKRRAAETNAIRAGSTFQAQFERDVAAHHHASRAARFTFGDVESLAFGRLDLASDDTLHIGKVSVVDEDGEVLLVDWRAPASAAFYRATAASPEGVARRRTLVTRGRHVSDLDDEIMDAEAAERLGLHAVTGQGALLAALSRHRSEEMRDIVATIQADQDAIIRAPARGTLVVTGGPGTGKTVVALHRVAYLLYEDRERFEGRGVLVVGPSRAFTEYTARVLPALGEDRAVQRPLAALVPPGASTHGWDDPETAQIKGSIDMVELCRRALIDTLPPIPPETRVSVDGTTAIVRAREINALRGRHLSRVQADEPGGTWLARKHGAESALDALIWRSWCTARHAQGSQPPSSPAEVDFATALGMSAQVTMLRRCYWPDRRPHEVLAQLVADRGLLESVALDVLGSHRAQRLVAAWSGARQWSGDDAPLLDELDALIGAERPAAKPKEQEAGIRLVSDTQRVEVTPVDIEASDYRDFAHVVVDEAQDLSPMQWRSVARRGPYASWTVVGDLGQRSRIGDPDSWEEIAALIGRRHVEVHKLTVNYRTPREIAEVARAIYASGGRDLASLPHSVRDAGLAPIIERTDDPTGAALNAAAALLDDHDGTVAVIAHTDDADRLSAVMQADPRFRRRARVLDPRTAKGLEFDDVILVGPDEIQHRSSTGIHDLYVAVTRATRSLHVICAPEARFAGMEVLAAASEPRRTGGSTVQTLPASREDAR